MSDIFQYYNLTKPPEYLEYQYTPQEIVLPEDTTNNFNKLRDLIFSMKSSKKESSKNPSVGILEEVRREMPYAKPQQNTTQVQQVEPKINYTKESFVKTFRPIIQKELQNQGIDINYTNNLLAQMALESAWGNRVGGSHNYSGLKSKTGKKVTTKEFKNGRYESIKDSFMNFNTKEDFIKYYVNRLKTKFKAFEEGDFLTNIRKHGYFTAPLSHYRAGVNLILKDISKIQ